jgi:methylated-DNA-[protein]-cysteine S-methyltransferase
VTTEYATYDSPVGPLLLLAAGQALLGLYMQEGRRPGAVGAARSAAAGGLLARVRDQLDEYFAGERVSFDLPLAPAGTAFQRLVWDELARIPYGRTTTYGELARRIDRPEAARAVGMANGRNPISIVVPCHRVIGSTGTLTGYAGGVERKRFLLDLEGGALALRG